MYIDQIVAFTGMSNNRPRRPRTTATGAPGHASVYPAARSELASRVRVVCAAGVQDDSAPRGGDDFVSEDAGLALPVTVRLEDEHVHARRRCTAWRGVSIHCPAGPLSRSRLVGRDRTHEVVQPEDSPRVTARLLGGSVMMSPNSRARSGGTFIAETDQPSASSSTCRRVLEAENAFGAG